MDDLKYIELLKLNKELSDSPASMRYEIGILSNVIVNPLKEILEYVARLNKIQPLVEIGNFDNIIQDSHTFFSKDMVVILYDTLNIIDSTTGFFENTEDEKYAALRDKLMTELDILFTTLKDCPSVVFNSFSSAYFTTGYTMNSRADQLVKELNAYLERKKPANFTIVNLDKIYLREGINNCIDWRSFQSSKAPYTFAFFKKYAQVMEQILLRNTGKLKKALILDCDNTLWKGVIGEDGMEGIDMSADSKTGRFFQMVQHIAVFLSRKGVIVGLCSKNNEEDVLSVLRNHKDAILKEEHIVVKRINWNDKGTNLREIASELNIGLDSLVFVDDSPFEINLIKEQLPDVMAVQVPPKPLEYVEALLKVMYTYFNLNTTAEDLQKTEMYKHQANRESEKNKFTSIEDYLASLEISIAITKNDFHSIERIAQLTQKTNQFNLTTIRYTENQIKQLMENGTVFSVSVSDKFGESGLTAVCIIRNDAEGKKKAIIDTMLMSCRIIGRNIETAILDYIFKWLKEAGFRTVVARFTATAKNAQVRDFYDNFGGNVIYQTETDKEYFFNLEEFQSRPVNYITVNH